MVLCICFLYFQINTGHGFMLLFYYLTIFRKSILIRHSVPLAMCHLYNRHIHVFVLDDWNNGNVISSRTQCPGRQERREGSKHRFLSFLTGNLRKRFLGNIPALMNITTALAPWSSRPKPDVSIRFSNISIKYTTSLS